MRALSLILVCAGCYNVDTLGKNYGRSADLGPTGGGVWQSLASPTTSALRGLALDGQAVSAVGASSTVLSIEDDVISAEPMPPGYSLRAAAAAGGFLWVVGDNGTVLQRGPSSWGVSSLGDLTLFGAFALDVNHLYTVGSGGGFFLNQTPVDTTAIRALYGVWARSATEVFAVGEGGVHIRAGTTSTADAIGGGPDLFAVHGNDSLVLAVGAGGTVMRSDDGVSWNPEDSGTNTDLYGVWVGSSSAFAVGAGGLVLRRSDGAWTVERSGGSPLRAVVGQDSNGSVEVWAVGDDGVLLHLAP